MSKLTLNGVHPCKYNSWSRYKTRTIKSRAAVSYILKAYSALTVECIIVISSDQWNVMKKNKNIHRFNLPVSSEKTKIIRKFYK